ncbi:ETC complex I subunit [Paracraurococcus lichenis]|uniref:ETC complex I subunit n=1 Tax=Paracraurococcus lichenis TaxID=3064888 RepID=A0ABT9DXG8_9PROT|nr:ETC complex I subunit [Paracraurococcus sp. LOR1-02]MDO9708591.1 ETC complex I subunit [Paracraurococcus sp. LOR1-02]
MPGPAQTARIYMPPRNAMQSGRGRTQEWVLEFEPGEKQRLDPLMGWSGSGDTRGQVRLRFPTREEAIAYAEANGLRYEVEEPKPVRIKAKVYADNFRFGRTDNWTH